LLLVAAPAASAEPSAADKETARSLLNEGDRKRDAKDLRGALAAYQAADAIMNVPSTAIEVAKTQERLGLLVEARDTALRIQRLPATSTEPRAFQQARAAADRLAGDLSQRVPSIRVIVRGPAADAVALTFDDEVIPKAAAGMPRKVNPGKHVVAAQAEGYERATAELAIQERENRELVLVLPASKEAARKTPSVARDDRAAAPNFAPPADAGDRQAAPSGTSPLVYVGGAVGAAGLVAGTIFGITELGRTSKAEALCQPGNDPAPCSAELDSAHRLATLSNLSFGVGALGAAVAVFALLRKPSQPSRSAAVNLQLVVQPSAASVAGTF
jgi:hypothetical protein